MYIEIDTVCIYLYFSLSRSGVHRERLLHGTPPIVSPSSSWLVLLLHLSTYLSWKLPMIDIWQREVDERSFLETQYRSIHRGTPVSVVLCLCCAYCLPIHHLSIHNLLQTIRSTISIPPPLHLLLGAPLIPSCFFIVFSSFYLVRSSCEFCCVYLTAPHIHIYRQHHIHVRLCYCCCCCTYQLQTHQVVLPLSLSLYPADSYSAVCRLRHEEILHPSINQSIH